MGSRLSRFAWAVVAFNVAVIAWGAYVRATGSGAGCGQHWPTCQGEVVPRAPALTTVIEYTHRLTSGLALLLVLALAVAARRSRPAAHPARRAAVAAFALVIVEALLGAGLVLFGFVAKDASPARGWVMAIHLTNTLLLLGALVLAAAWGGAPAGPVLRGRRGVVVPLLLAALAVLVAGASGAVAALGDTLYPATSLGHGLRQDLGGEGGLLLRLRLLHPPLAVVAALAVGWAVRRAGEAAEARVGAMGTVAIACAWAQIGLGVLNVTLLAPVWLQLAHLALADVLWIALVTVAARACWPQGEGAPAAG